MIGSNIKLYSWIDIQDQLVHAQQKHDWKDGVFIEVRQSGIYIYHKSEVSKNDIKDWLDNYFPRAIKNIDGYDYIELESMGLKEGRYLDVVWEKIEEGEFEMKLDFTPSFARPRGFASQPENNARDIEEEESLAPQIIVVHSFKGGVGRTLHAMALAYALSLEEGQSVLLVDGDLEAPGTTWLTPNPEISFVDFLNLIHGSREPHKIIPAVANDLQNQKQGNIYFLPAFRTDSQLRSLEIKPEHIYRFSDDPFLLTEMLRSLGEQLGVTHIILDLRAGISELSSNWLLDPRIHKIFVTTLSSQSVEGTKIMLELLEQYAEQYPTISPIRELPSIIISQINKELVTDVINVWEQQQEATNSISLQNTEKLKSLFANYTDSLSNTDAESVAIFSEIYPNLRVLPTKWDEITKLLSSSGLLENLTPLVSLLEAGKGNTPAVDGKIEQVEKIKEKISPLVYAETQESLPEGFYKSEAIRALAEKHQTRLPNVVVHGSKGSGKTFLYQQLRSIATWTIFLQRVLGENSVVSELKGNIVPVTFPGNDSTTSPIWERHTREYLIESQKQEQFNTIDWRNVWLDVIAWSNGYKVGETAIGKQFIEEAEKKAERYIFIFDGLEDLFTNYHKSLAQKTALRSLLQDVPQYIGVSPNSPIGLVIFIRQDIIEHAIEQNTQQFLSKHNNYKLKWNATEALRLVVWLLKFHEIISLESIDYDDILNASNEELTKILYPLWGRKLGTDSSRQARTAKRVLETLSNYNEELQSRDMVSFLATAADEELKLGNQFEDRLLSPKAIRDAFPIIGKQKVNAIKEENKENELATILNVISQHSSSIQVPFEQNEHLTSSQLNELINQGILRKHEGRYYMAELFRLGFDIQGTTGVSKTNFR